MRGDVGGETHRWREIVAVTNFPAKIPPLYNISPPPNTSTLNNYNTMARADKSYLVDRAVEALEKEVAGSLPDWSYPRPDERVAIPEPLLCLLD